MAGTSPHTFSQPHVIRFVETYRLEDVFVGLVVHSVLQRDIHCVILSFAQTHVRHVPRSGEIVPVFVEGDSHHTVRQVKGFFDTVSVVDVDVDVHHTRIYSMMKSTGKHDFNNSNIPKTMSFT